MTRKNRTIAELAALIPVEVIIDSLANEGTSPADFFLYGDRDAERALIAYWHPTNGLMARIIEDNVLAFAVKKYLYRLNAHHYSDSDELMRNAFQERWPNLLHGIAHGEWLGEVYGVKMYEPCTDDEHLRWLIIDLKYAPRVKLDLSRGRISDVGLKALQQLTQLEEVDLSGNPVSENAIRDLRAILPGCRIVL